MTTSGDHAYNCGANAAIVGECSCSLSTPTPGDLSARHWDAIRALLTDYRAALGIIAKHEGPVASKISKEAEEAIAALSALPAAGGAWNDWSGGPCLLPLGTRVAYRMRGHGEEEFEDLAVDLNWSHHGERDYEIVAYKVLTTPQPSAAEEIGPHPLNICPKCKDYYMECECPADAAVGAQGDGEAAARAAFEQQAKGWRNAIPWDELHDDTRKLWRDFVARRADAAPAAGKGVDADMFMSAFNCEAENTTGTRLYDSERQNVINALEAALTRQPVAGDGRLSDDDVKWIVNDLAELGVMIRGQAFFLYKGESLVYKDGTHDDGTPMLYRMVGKREFGECCHPVKFYRDDARLPGRYTEQLVYTPGLSFGKPEDGDWQPLPAAPAATPTDGGEG